MTIYIPLELIGSCIGVGIFVFGCIVGYSMGRQIAETEAEEKRLDEMLDIATRPDSRR